MMSQKGPIFEEQTFRVDVMGYSKGLTATCDGSYLPSAQANDIDI